MFWVADALCRRRIVTRSCLVVCVALLFTFAESSLVRADPEISSRDNPEDQPSTDEKPPPWDVSGRIQYSINGWLNDLVSSAIDPVFRLLGKTILATPRLDEHPRVVELWKFSLGLADAALILFVLVGAAVVMTGGLASQVTMKELLPRLLIAAGMANLSSLIVGQLISFSNALSLAMLEAAAEPGNVATPLTEGLFRAGAGGPLLLLFALAAVVLAVLVLVAYVVRIAALVVLVAGGPLLLIAYALPHTEYVAKVWWRLMGGLVAVPVVQALLLTGVTKVFLSSDGLLGGSSLIDLLVIGCLLYLLYRTPLWTIHAALRGSGSKVWATAKEKTVQTVKAVVAA
jgi:hypothetical protein